MQTISSVDLCELSSSVDLCEFQKWRFLKLMRLFACGLSRWTQLAHTSKVVVPFHCIVKRLDTCSGSRTNLAAQCLTGSSSSLI